MYDRDKIVLLLDYYGSLLSDKQLRAISSYYYEDFSLSEIADIEGISKQGVSDLISRSEKKLISIEEDLHLVERNQKLLDKLRILSSHLNSIVSENRLEELNTLKYELDQIINSVTREV